ncbi:peptidylprolyl isomerase [Candidatus Pandoraea novymonadis]|uniref:peptidylprolyl isomerase n=1 Tax=Candidatus Pandoraea novymonadis TaxID=1808959 RepID=A0ABX5FFV4_9BURK|nr:peptidylprolyl isomerase [Candidatus Pandoraea novymonadis]PSB92127.1 putative parvulin-type peptidyl-prolyl cis-trans isomerase [Candidatus Pandoraea novymonadis]
MALNFAHIALSLTAIVSLSTFAQNVAIVNGSPIPTSRVNVMLNEMVQQGYSDSPELRQQIRGELVKREILAQEAIRRGIAARADVKTQVELTKQTVLIRALVTDIVKSPISDDELQARYDEIKQQIGDKEYRPSHILLEDEDTAKKIIIKLKNGVNFSKLAKQYSKDKGSAKNGGRLEWSSASSYVSEFKEVLLQLKKGQIIETPVKTNFGYHVIKLDDLRNIQVPSLAELKPQLEHRAREERMHLLEENLIEKSKIR